MTIKIKSNTNVVQLAAPLPTLPVLLPTTEPLPPLLRVALVPALVPLPALLPATVAPAPAPALDQVAMPALLLRLLLPMPLPLSTLPPLLLLPMSLLLLPPSQPAPLHPLALVFFPAAPQTLASPRTLPHPSVFLPACCWFWVLPLLCYKRSDVTT